MATSDLLDHQADHQADHLVDHLVDHLEDHLRDYQAHMVISPDLLELVHLSIRTEGTSISHPSCGPQLAPLPLGSNNGTITESELDILSLSCIFIA